MPNPKAPVFLTTARDATVRYLRSNPAAYWELRQRCAMQGKYPAYAQAIAKACPELARTYYDDVIPMVSEAMLAQPRRIVQPVPRVAA
jgi:hypothetical protein